MISILLFTNCVQSQPKIELSGNNQKDWGKVSPKDSPLRYTLVIKNVGNDLLTLKNVRPTCGCTTAPLKKSELKPGESTDVDVTFNVGSNTGLVTKSIIVESNDPNNSSISYMLRAEVVRSLTISPATYMAFSNLKVGQESQAKVTITNSSNKPITLTNLNVEPIDMKVNFSSKKTIQPKESYEVVVKVTPKKSGNMNTKLSFQTNSEDYPTLDIYGYGRVEESPIFNNK